MGLCTVRMLTPVHLVIIWESEGVDIFNVTYQDRSVKKYSVCETAIVNSIIRECVLVAEEVGIKICQMFYLCEFAIILLFLISEYKFPKRRLDIGSLLLRGYINFYHFTFEKVLVFLIFCHAGRAESDFGFFLPTFFS